jgi:adenylosuccinate lyase
VILPDAFLACDFMTVELADIVEHLRVDPVAMRRNLEAGGGLVFSQRVLLALTASGLARDDAYRLVQEHALAALEGRGEFREGLEADPRVTGRLAKEQLAGCFDLGFYLRSVDDLFARAGAPPG